MSVSRRRFLLVSGTILGGLSGSEILQGAEGASARAYTSQRSIWEIAKGLVLGIGREAWQSVKGLGPGPVVDFVERLNARHFEAQVQTLRHPIDVAFDHVELKVDGIPRPEKIEEYITALQAIANEDADQLVSEQEAQAVVALVERASEELHHAIERGAVLRLNYNVRYRRAYFHISNLVQRGHVRLDLSLLRSVNMFNGAAFVADLRRAGACTQVHTSLWADVCTGRREGPLVRRIARREIGCRAARFLAEVEHEVRVLVTNEGDSRLSRMIPELIRRIAEGSPQG